MSTPEESGGKETPTDSTESVRVIHSEMLSAYYGEMKKKLDESGTLAIWVSKANEKPLAALKQVVLDKIDLMGSAGKA